MKTTTISKRYIQPGERVTVTLPWSEVCMFMRIAETTMDIEITADGRGVQVFDAAGTPFSFPITLGEAGVYSDALGSYIVQP